VIAHHRAALVLAGGDHQHVTLAHHVQHGHGRQVVPWPTAGGDRDTHEALLGVQALDGVVHAVPALLRIGDEAGLGAGELAHQGRRGALDGAADAKRDGVSDHGTGSVKRLSGPGEATRAVLASLART